MSSILFVCTGNICRSPSAEALLRHAVGDEKHEIDSAGTHSYHIGSRPSKEGLKILERKNISTKGITARKVEKDDFHRFDLIIAMDHGHYEILKSLEPDNAKAKIKMFADFCNQYDIEEVPDPYYGGPKDYEDMMDILEDGISGLVKTI